MTDCPLCLGPSRQSLLCDGCCKDTFEQRQQRMLCQLCTADMDCGSATNPFRNRLDFSLQPPESRICITCRRNPPSYDWIGCALDDGFPAALMLERFFGRSADISLAPAIASLMWRACQLQESARIDCWIALPATEEQVRLCRCSPAWQLALALARISGIKQRSAWLSLCDPDNATGSAEVSLRASSSVTDKSVALVVARLESLTLIDTAAKALKVAGARRVVVLCAA